MFTVRSSRPRGSKTNIWPVPLEVPATAKVAT